MNFKRKENKTEKAKAGKGMMLMTFADINLIAMGMSMRSKSCRKTVIIITGGKHYESIQEKKGKN